MSLLKLSNMRIILGKCTRANAALCFMKHEILGLEFSMQESVVSKHKEIPGAIHSNSPKNATGPLQLISQLCLDTFLLRREMSETVLCDHYRETGFREIFATV